MGIFTNSNGYSDPVSGEEIEVNMDELMEQFFFDEHYADSDEEKRALFESAESILLEKKNITSKKTLVRLNKNDDLSRRSTMAAMQIAKDKNDSLWKALVKNRIQERKLLRAIKKKYGNAATRLAKIAQNNYIRGANKSKMLKKSDISKRD
jgi:hypothetical protein